MMIPFVQSPPIDETIAYIQQCVKYHAIGIISAPRGAGLSRILQHCCEVSTYPLIQIALFEPAKSTVRGLQIASAISAVGYSLLWAALNRRSRPQSELQRFVHHTQAMVPLTDNSFLKAHDAILGMLDNPRRVIEGILIDNADLVDVKFCKLLLTLRNESHQPPAIIFGVRQEGFATHTEALQTQRNVIPTLEDVCQPIHPLKAMTRELFDEIILPHLLNDQNIVLDPLVEAESDSIVDVLWRETQGNWRRIQRFYDTLMMVVQRRDTAGTLVWTMEGYTDVVAALKR